MNIAAIKKYVSKTRKSFYEEEEVDFQKSNDRTCFFAVSDAFCYYVYNERITKYPDYHMEEGAVYREEDDLYVYEFFRDEVPKYDKDKYVLHTLAIKKKGHSHL